MMGNINYHQLAMAIFHSYVKLPEGRFSISCKRACTFVCNDIVAQVREINAIGTTLGMIQGGAPQLAKLVNITPISQWFMLYITIVNGGHKPTYSVWGTHLVCTWWFGSLEHEFDFSIPVGHCIIINIHKHTLELHNPSIQLGSS